MSTTSKKSRLTMSGKHAKSEDENDFEAAEKGIQFDQQWRESFDRAEQKREGGVGAYAPDRGGWGGPQPPRRGGEGSFSGAGAPTHTPSKEYFWCKANP